MSGDALRGHFERSPERLRQLCGAYPDCPSKASDRCSICPGTTDVGTVIGVALIDHRPLRSTLCICRWQGDDIRVHLVDVLAAPITALLRADHGITS